MVANAQYHNQYQYRKESLDSNTNNNTNNNTNIGGKALDARRRENIADRLVLKFNNPGYKEFYCRVAWRLSEQTIWNYVEESFNKGRNPAKYFSFLCKKAGV